MTEIIVLIVAIRVFYEQMFIALWHRMRLWDMGDNMEVVGYLASIINRYQPPFYLFRPLSSNTVKIPSLGIELPFDGIGRDDNLSLTIMFNKIPQPSRMVAVPMRDKYIIHHTEVNA